jgi:hypothetical protein
MRPSRTSRFFLVWLFGLSFWMFAGPLFAQTVPASELLKAANSDIQSLPDGWRLVSGQREPSQIIWNFEAPNGASVQVVLQAKDPTKNAYAVTRSFIIFYKSEGDNSDTPVRNLMDTIAERVQANDTGMIALIADNGVGSLQADRTDQQAGIRPAGMPDSVDADLYRILDAAERALAFVLIFFAIAGLFWALHISVHTITAAPKFDRLAWIIILALGLLVRLWVEPRLVMTYSGYGLIEQALHFGALKKYGAGTPLLYHLLMRTLPGDPGSVYLMANKLFGWLSIVLGSVWLQRYLNTRAVGVAAAILLSFSPLLIKDHASESNVVPTMMIVFAGLLLFDAWRRTPRRSLLALAVTTMLFAIFCRPLMLVLLPISIVLLEPLRGDRNLGRFPLKTLLWAGLLCLPILAPHIGFLYLHYLGEMETGHAAGFAAWVSGPLERLTSEQNLFLRYDLTPVVLPLLWVFAFTRADIAQIPRLVSLALISAIFFTAYFVDMPAPSLPRLEAPAIFWMTLISANGLANLWRQPLKKIWWSQFLLLAVFVLACLPPIHTLWENDNDQQEDLMLTEAARMLPADARFLGRLAVNDLPMTWGVFRTYPDYRFQNHPNPPTIVRLGALSAWLDGHKKTGLAIPKGVYVYLGMRCYSLVLSHIPEHLLDANVPESAATPDYQHPLCTKMRTDYRLAPVVERAVDNHDIFQRFLWYPPRLTLRVGLYRVEDFATSTDEGSRPKP